ncbi:MAG: capsular polysaccharide synthesis protein [Parvularcula sp.]
MRKTVWIYWQQGWENAPDVALQCLKSWRFYNPDWEVVALDDASLPNYGDIEKTYGVVGSKMPRAAFSDLIRLFLLREYGGVWADATCLCVRPLEEWLDSALGSERAFVFSSPSADRLITDYFVAGEAGAKLIAKWDDAIQRLWRRHPDRAVASAGFTRRWLKQKQFTEAVHLDPKYFEGPYRLPYFWMHYTYAYLVLTDTDFAKSAQALVEISAEPTLLFARRGYGAPLTDNVILALKNGAAPLYKLDWRENTIGPAVQFALDEQNWPPARGGGRPIADDL